MMDVSRRRRQQALRCLDLTSLNDNDTEASVKTLAGRAVTDFGSVAALCVWPRFLKTARQACRDPRVKLAAVANFPSGRASAAVVAREVEAIVAEGADEVDVVLPYEALIAGDHAGAASVISAARRASGAGITLKVILESGELQKPDLIALAAGLALDEGADFLKTSTGKSKVSATLDAARILLETLRDRRSAAGFKASGGIRDGQSAQAYLDLAAEILGEDWISPLHFRFGASGLLDDLIRELSGQEAKPSTARTGY